MDMRLCDNVVGDKVEEETFAERYTECLKFAQGGSAELFKAKEAATNHMVCLKVIWRESPDGDAPKHARKMARIAQEVDILKQVSHINVIRMLHAFHTPMKVVLVFEYCPDGDLWSVISVHGKLAESQAAFYFSMIAKGVKYLHSKRIVHRDLKPENILIAPDGTARITDFGSAKVLLGAEKLFDGCGTPVYSCPQMLLKSVPEFWGKGVDKYEGYCGYAADCWSLGILLWTMLEGSLPFEAPVFHGLYVNISATELHLSDSLSESCKSLLKGLIELEENRRLQIDDAVRHLWVAQAMSCDKEEPLSSNQQSSPNTGVRRKFSSDSEEDIDTAAEGMWYFHS